MTLWTIQSEAAFNTLERTGCLRADSCFSLCNNYPIIEYAYRWIADRMRQRVSPSPDGVEYPIWAWYQWEGIRKRSDMRRGGYAKRGTAIALLTIDIPDQQVLLFDFDIFHYPLNGWVAAKTEEEEKMVEARCSSLGYTHQDLTDYRIQTNSMRMLRDEVKQSKAGKL